MAKRLSHDEIKRLLGLKATERTQHPNVQVTDVFIAGSGPIACAYARTIMERDSSVRVLMAEIGSQDDPLVGGHHKNSIKYQKDIDSFVNVIKGALQTVSLAPGDTFIPNLGGNAWAPEVNQQLIFQGSNPNQDQELNLKDSAVTRTVGGMATHWTCACPNPHPEERAQNPIDKGELDDLLKRAGTLLDVNTNEYDNSIRHRVVRKTLVDTLGENRGVQNLPLAVKRRQDNPDYVTWSGSNTVLGEVVNDPRFKLLTETRVTSLHLSEPGKIGGVLVRNLKNDQDILIHAKSFVIACGAVGTPQILHNSGIRPHALGRYLAEQSIAFCQIVLKRDIVDGIATNPEFRDLVEKHKKKHPRDPLPIPFNDPEPQVMIPYSTEFPYHCQVHRDAFSYGDVGPRADARVVVDLRFFGKQDTLEKNRVYFGQAQEMQAWVAGVTDIYGMPQPTFEVRRSTADQIRDHKMMKDMTAVANDLGAFLPGSEPQFMNPGLAVHITGTTRIGKDPKTSVADPTSKVHGYHNLWVGGNGCIPDSTACNPTRTSVAIALKGAETACDYWKANK